MSWIARRLRLGKWRYFQGYDLEGNKYFQMPNRQATDPTDPRTMKRLVEYAQEKPMWAYQGNEMAVQWAAWLRRTRADPPTLDELQQDRIRQMRLQENVLRLKQEYAEEKERLRISQSLPQSSSALPASSSPHEQHHRSAAETAAAAAASTESQSPPPRSADQPKEAPNPLAAQDKAAQQAQQTTRQLENQQEAGARSKAQQQEEAEAKQSLREQELPQTRPNAERPGAKALKNNPVFNQKISENPDASWQPQSAAPKVARRR